MAIFGFFKKDKSKASSSQASTTSPPTPAVDDASSAESYVLPPPSLSIPSLGNGDDGYTSSSASFVSAASSKKIRLPFTKKSAPPPSSPLVRTLEPPRNLHIVSTDKLSLRVDTTFDSPSLHFQPLHESNSTPTLARPDPNIRPRPASLQKADAPNDKKSGGGLFNWRERKKSKPPKPDPDALVLPPVSDTSFNLKSFRHVLPEPRSNSPQRSNPVQSPSSLSLVPPPRPRGASVASTDSSQRISVAAFREAQARRSSTNLVNGSPSPTIRPVSLANSTVSDIVPSIPPLLGRSSATNSSKPGRAGQTNPRRSTVSMSSEATSSEESESDEGSPSRSRSRLSRQRTITRRSYGARSDLGHGASRTNDHSHHQQTTSARSELGHGSPVHTSQASPSPSRGPPPSSFLKTAEAAVGTRSFSLYRRQRASYSTSELSQSAAAQRASAVAAANQRERAAAQRQRVKDSDTSDSSSNSESSDEDAPLSSLKLPARPGSAFSNRSSGSAVAVRKPLIDLNMKTNPLSGKLIKDDEGTEQRHKGRPTLISPTDINGRLSQLTSAAGLKGHRRSSASKSEANLSNRENLRPSFADATKPDSPASTNTIIAPQRTESPEPIPSNPRRASLSALSTVQDPTQVKAGDARPVPVKDRFERDTGFKVVSRPQKASTLPPSGIGASDGTSQRVSVESPLLSHRRQSSSTTTFTVTSRPQTYMPPVSTTRLVPPSQSRSSVSASGSSVSGTSNSSRVVHPAQRLPPQRPFAVGGKRQESPASSTGGSSSGKAPLTPMDGSDYFSPDVRGSGDSLASSSVGATPPSAMKGARGHLKRASVTFQEPPELEKDDTMRGRKSNLGQTKVLEPKNAVEERENRLRDRRRSEAKAAIELANVINGRGPMEPGDDGEDPLMPPRIPPLNTGGIGLDFNRMSVGWQQQGIASPMMGGMPSMGQMGPMGGMPNMGMGVNLNPAQFMFPPPPPGVDAAYLAAHQQAMRIAKQAYQYVVAQQAMAAAADEWERGSSVSAFTAPGAGMGMGTGGYGMSGMNSMGGMGGMWGGMPMYPPAPRSLYAGNMGGGAMSEVRWGAASVYGEAFGPSSNARRSQIFNSHARDSSGASAGGSSSTAYRRTESSGNLPQSTSASSRNVPRPRTKTAPSSTQVPPQHRLSRGPPSSWKAGS